MGQGKLAEQRTTGRKTIDLPHVANAQGVERTVTSVTQLGDVGDGIRERGGGGEILQAVGKPKTAGLVDEIIPAVRSLQDIARDLGDLAGKQVTPLGGRRLPDIEQRDQIVVMVGRNPPPARDVGRDHGFRTGAEPGASIRTNFGPNAVGQRAGMNFVRGMEGDQGFASAVVRDVENVRMRDRQLELDAGSEIKLCPERGRAEEGETASDADGFQARIFHGNEGHSSPFPGAPIPKFWYITAYLNRSYR